MDLNLWMRRWALLWILVLCRGQTDEDEKRPYKFAFAIEGYQHRSEEKDEKGIIMGEFGFVTGDGVYHVTVYATDENGNFKILKMKNYYIGLPGEGTTVAPTRAPPPTTRATTSAPVPSTTKSSVIKHLEGLMGCSGCIVPIKNGQGSKGTPGTTPPSNYGEGLIDNRFGDGENKSPGISGGNAFGGGSPSLGGGGTYTGGAGGNRGGSGSSGGTAGGNGGIGITGGGGSASPGVVGIQGGGNTYSGVGGGSGGGFGPGSPGSASQTPSNPTSGANSGGNYGTPGNSSGPRPTGSQNPNLPPGMSMEDLMALLYKFNYTLKYHGHHESGYRNGDKEGGYFFNGRDGFGRNVKYIANEFGFQPNITLVDLGLKHPDTPQEENEENELRGNEFKWFYKR